MFQHYIYLIILITFFIKNINYIVKKHYKHNIVISNKICWSHGTADKVCWNVMHARINAVDLPT